MKVLNQAVKRNIERFPEDFMFRLTAGEAAFLRSHTVTLKPGRGRHRKYLPYAFSEQGVAMLSSVLRSRRAVGVNIEIMRTFVRLRRMLAFHAELARKLAELEKKYDAQFKVVFDAIRELMTPPDSREKRPIGFAPRDEADDLAAPRRCASRRGTPGDAVSSRRLRGGVWGSRMMAMQSAGPPSPAAARREWPGGGRRRRR